MPILFLVIGLSLAIIDIFWRIKSLKENIFKRIFLIVIGIVALFFVDKKFLYVSSTSFFMGL